MKKTFKRAGVAVLSMAMLLSMGAVGTFSASAAYADGNGGLAVTSTATTISAYKVADASSGNWAWVSGITSVDTTDMAKLAGNTATADDLVKIADKLAGDSDLPTAKTLTAGATNELAAGYYLIVSTGAGKVYQNSLVEVKNGETNALDTSSKETAVTVNKTITNVTNGGVVDGSEGKVATAEASDTITYQIATTIPGYSSEANTTSMHDYEIEDTYDSNFSNINITGVSIAGNNLTAGDGYEYSPDTSNHKFTITVDKNVVLAHPNQTVTVTFTATFTAPSTPNTDYKYANNVNFTYDNTYNATGGSEKLSSEADVYSIPLKIKKTDNSGDLITATGGSFTLTATDPFTTQTKDITNGYAKFDSLAAGTYTLTEATAPSGYKKITIDIAQIKVAVATDGKVSVQKSTDGTTWTDLTADNDTIYMDTVENELLDTLPGTGGIGTTLFTVGGAAVVLLAGFMFVVYMKKRKAED